MFGVACLSAMVEINTDRHKVFAVIQLLDSVQFFAGELPISVVVSSLERCLKLVPHHSFSSAIFVWSRAFVVTRHRIKHTSAISFFWVCGFAIQYSCAALMLVYVALHVKEIHHHGWNVSEISIVDVTHYACCIQPGHYGNISKFGLVVDVSHRQRSLFNHGGKEGADYRGDIQAIPR